MNRRTRASTATTGAAAVLACALLAACGGESPVAPAAPSSTPSPAAPSPTEAATQAVQGAVALPKAWWLAIERNGSACMGHSGYADISAGDQVTIADATGEIVAITELKPSQLLDDEACVWYFDAAVPTGGKFYTATYDQWTSPVVPEGNFPEGMLTVLPSES